MSLDDDYDDGDAYDEDLEQEEGSQDDGDKDLEEVAFPLYKKDFWGTPNVE